MSFPFSIDYSRPLKRQVAASEVNMVAGYIKEFLTKKTAENILINVNQVSFDVDFFRIRWRSDVIGTIDQGRFIIDTNGNGSAVTYKFSMYRLVALICLGAIIGGLFSQQIWVALVFFCLGVINWFVTMVRHEKMLAKIVMGVNALLDR